MDAEGHNNWTPSFWSASWKSNEKTSGKRKGKTTWKNEFCIRFALINIRTGIILLLYGIFIYSVHAQGSGPWIWNPTRDNPNELNRKNRVSRLTRIASIAYSNKSIVYSSSQLFHTLIHYRTRLCTRNMWTSMVSSSRSVVRNSSILCSHSINVNLRRKLKRNERAIKRMRNNHNRTLPSCWGNAFHQKNTYGNIKMILKSHKRSCDRSMLSRETSSFARNANDS